MAGSVKSIISWTFVLQFVILTFNATFLVHMIYIGPSEISKPSEDIVKFLGIFWELMLIAILSLAATLKKYSDMKEEEKQKGTHPSKLLNIIMMATVASVVADLHYIPAIIGAIEYGFATWLAVIVGLFIIIVLSIVLYMALRHFECKYLFNWDDVTKNNTEIIKFLKEYLKINWAENAEIKKINNNDNETINVAKGTNTITLKLDKEKKRMTLEITGGKTYNYTLKEESDKQNIYEDCTMPEPTKNLCWYFVLAIVGIVIGYYLLNLQKSDTTLTLILAMAIGALIANTFGIILVMWEKKIIGEKWGYEVIDQNIKVIDEKTTNPIPNAEIDIPALRWKVTTDNNGRAKIPLPVGLYKIEVTKDTTKKEQNIDVCPGDNEIEVKF